MVEKKKKKIKFNVVDKLKKKDEKKLPLAALKHNAKLKKAKKAKLVPVREAPAVPKKPKKAKEAKGVIKSKAEKKARIIKKVRELGKAQIAKKKEKKKDFTAKPKPKKTAGESLTGLTAAQMNAMTPLELFGKLPVRVASGVVLNPKRTGVKVAQESVGKHISQSAGRHSRVYYKGTDTDPSLQDFEIREALHSGIFYGIGGTTDPNLPSDNTHYDKKKEEMRKFGIITAKRKNLRDDFFNDYYRENIQGVGTKGVGKKEAVIKSVVDNYFKTYRVKKEVAATRRAEMTKFFSNNLNQALKSGTMGQSWVDMEYNKIRKKYPKAKIQRTNQFNPKGDYKMNFVVNGRVLTDDEMKEFE